MKLFLLCTALFFFYGCSSSHQIPFSVLPVQSAAKKRPFAIGIYAPDTLKNYTQGATLSGGVCKGHEFQLNIGNGILAAMQQGLGSIFDSVIFFSTTQGMMSSRKF